MLRSLATMLLAFLLMTTAALAESSSLDEAKLLVPETATLTETDYDDGLWEYEFRHGEQRYEVVMNGTKTIAFTVRTGVKPAKTNTLTKETALAFVSGEVLYGQTEKDDGRWVWKIITREENDLLEYELHAETGELIELERYFAATLELPAAYRQLDLELDDGRLQWDTD